MIAIVLDTEAYGIQHYISYTPSALSSLLLLNSHRNHGWCPLYGPIFLLMLLWQVLGCRRACIWVHIMGMIWNDEAPILQFHNHTILGDIASYKHAWTIATATYYNNYYPKRDEHAHTKWVTRFTDLWLSVSSCWWSWQHTAGLWSDTRTSSQRWMHP